MAPNFRLIAAASVLVGDMLDLEGDAFADHNSDNVTFEFELGLVVGFEFETPDCVRIDLAGENSFGCPPDHMLKLHNHDPEVVAE